MTKRFSFLLIFSGCIFLSFIGCKKNNKSAVITNNILGVDISHHNGEIDFSLLNRKNVQFVYIKSTEGVSFTDKNYKKNVQDARKHNLKVGAYHFFIFSENGVQQANHFLNNTDIVSGDLVPVLDVEYSRNNPISNDSAFILKIRNEINSFSNLIKKKIGEYPLIYCNESMSRKLNLSSSPYKFWIVDLQKQPSDSIDWLLWQFEHQQKISKNLSVNFSKIRENKNGLKSILLKY